MSSKPLSPCLIDLQNENSDHHQHTLRQRGETNAQITTVMSLQDTLVPSMGSKKRAESPRKGNNARRERVLKYRNKHSSLVQRRDQPENDDLNADKGDHDCIKENNTVDMLPKIAKSFEDTKIEVSKTSITGQLSESHDQLSTERDTNGSLQGRSNDCPIKNVVFIEEKCEDSLDLERQDNHDPVEAVHNFVSFNPAKMPTFSSAPNHVESTKNVNTTSCETVQSENGGGSGWDTRSVLEHPLDSAPPIVSDLDGAWDTSTTSFTVNSKKAKSKPQHEVDIADSSSWILNTAGPSEVTGNAFIVEPHESSTVRALNQENQLRLSTNCHQESMDIVHKFEMKEFEQAECASTTKGTTNDVEIERTNEESSESENFGWPAPLAENFTDCQAQEPPFKLLSPKDDVALLEQIQERSDITSSSKFGTKEDFNHLQKERIDHYTSERSYADSSSDDDEEVDNGSEQSDINQEIQYVVCDGDENDIVSFEDVSRTNESATAEHSSVSNHTAAVLDVAAVAAEAAEISPPNRACLDDSFSNPQFDPRLTPDSKTEKIHSIGAAAMIVSKLERRDKSLANYTINSLQKEPDSLDQQTEKVNIPLLPPPPKEKFKKWQESKRQPRDFFVTGDDCEEGYNTIALLVPSESTQSEGNAGDEMNWNVEVPLKGVAAQEPKAITQVKQPEVDCQYPQPLGCESIESFHECYRPRRNGSCGNDEIVLSGEKLGCESIESFHECYMPGRNGSCENEEIVRSGEKLAEKIALASSTTVKLLEKSLRPEHTSANSVADSNLNSENEDDSSIFCGGTETLQKNLLELAGDSLPRCDPTPTKEISSDAIANDNGVSAPSGFASPSSGFSCWTKECATDNNCDSAASYNDLLTSVTPIRAHLLPKSGINTKISDIQIPMMRHPSETPKIKIVANDDFLLTWLRCLLLQANARDKAYPDARTEIRSLLDENDNFDRLCAHVSMKVNSGIESEFLHSENLPQTGVKVKQIVPFSLANKAQPPQVLAANFVSFLQRIGTLTGIDPPFEDANPFLAMILPESAMESKLFGSPQNLQQLVFSNPGSDELTVTRFLYTAAQTATTIPGESQHQSNKERHLRRPEGGPSPFETSTWTLPGTIVMILGMLGDPVAVCRMKMVNRFCNRLISENEHTVMRDAVRLGGMSMNIRPAFWMWITIENCGKPMRGTDTNQHVPPDLNDLAQRGRSGKWHSVIERDVARAFGNMPPHKTGARLRADSIVRALVTFGRSRFLKRGVRGGGEAHPTPSLASLDGQRTKPPSRESTAPPPWEIGDGKLDESERSESPTDTVSDWGGVSPVPSFSSVAEDIDTKKHHSLRRVGSLAGDESEIRHVHSIKEELSSACAADQSGKTAAGNSDDEVQEELALSGSVPSHEASDEAVEELALSGNTLSNEMKIHLQNQLSIILHALAAQHEDVGYCQGLDYVVAHLLRVLQDTVKWREMKRSASSSSISSTISNVDDSTKLSVFRVMDCFFTTYNMKHMYYPELRSLKICCRVFEKLILLKLPVLADHFEHHELNVGLFALGWFQTLFLYLPSMPTATVCHMWDIWLVERSFKIFFRVGAAILFLSQPILLNHDLEGMMTYLNTFPDATLLKPDILIACALQIKVTNRMLTELELEVTSGV